VTTPEARYARMKTTAVSVWGAIGVLILVAVALWGLGKIAGALVPFVVAFVIAFLLNWPVRALAARGMPRGAATLVCLLVGMVALGIAVTLLAPTASRQIVSFAREAPAAFAQLNSTASQVQSRFSRLIVPAWTRSAVEAVSAQVSSVAVTVGSALASRAVNTGGDVLTGFFDVFIALVIAFWALKDLPKIREEILLIAGPKFEGDAELLIGTVTKVVGGYLKGQTIASLTTGALAAIGLAIIGVPYALVLGIITFFFNYVPYVGPFASGLIAGLVGLVFVSPWAGLLAVLVIVVAQNFTDTVITPRVMSDQVDLHPIIVIFSLLVGGTLFGIPGMLFAIPVAATGKGLFVYYYERRTERSLASEDGALFRGIGSDPTDESRPDQPSPGGMAV
jgi:predicted PurR-regulated permease PerM